MNKEEIYEKKKELDNKLLKLNREKMALQQQYVELQQLCPHNHDTIRKTPILPEIIDHQSMQSPHFYSIDHFCWNCGYSWQETHNPEEKF